MGVWVWYDVAKLYLEELMLFNAVIEKDEDGYFAHIPELKGCMTQGSTYEEALINIKEAAELYLESLEIEEVKSFQNRLFSITPIEVNYHAHLS
jgi:predicted RNase H-like HicB family nuclease